MKAAQWTKAKRLWLMPCLVALLTLQGLLVTLIGDGVYDWLGNLSLAAPALLCGLVIKNWAKRK
jgi:hypothetical protein